MAHLPTTKRADAEPREAETLESAFENHYCLVSSYLNIT